MSNLAFERDNFTMEEYHELRHRKVYAEGTTRMKQAVRDFYDAVAMRVSDEREYKKEEWEVLGNRYMELSNLFLKTLIELPEMKAYTDTSENIAVWTFCIDQNRRLRYMVNIASDIAYRNKMFLFYMRWATAIMKAITRSYSNGIKKVYWHVHYFVGILIRKVLMIMRRPRK